MRFRIFLEEREPTRSSMEAEKRGLVSIGFGRYVKKNVPDVVVAVADKDGNLTDVKPEMADTKERDFDGGSDDWMSQHFHKTENGSTIIGTPHIGEEGAKEFVHKRLIPLVLKKAAEAIKDGKKVVFMAEGEDRGDDWGEDNDEQDMIALALKKKFGNKVIQDTWDDNTSPYTPIKNGEGNKVNPNSEMFKKLVSKFKDPSLVDVALSAMDAGQGSYIEFSDQAKKRLAKAGINREDEKSLYKLSFPADHGGKKNNVSVIVDEYNKLRRNRMIEKSKQIEASGGVAISTPGASHAFDLKREHKKRVIK